jgi:hypothetical protein
VRTIYRHAELINREFGETLRAQVHHPQDPDHVPDWFTPRVPVKKERRWSPESELVIVPEVWAHPLGGQLRATGLNYCVFVQNGYSIHSHGSYDELVRAYADAARVLTISADTTRCVTALFADVAPKVLELQNSVDASRFDSAARKENVISYMPRKQAAHAAMVRFHSAPHLPAGWTFDAIDGVVETEVARRLSRSRIFLSFAELEGFSLPPVEAALAGNYVIGYTGEGAREYWDPPIFTEVRVGDAVGFATLVRERIDALAAAPGSPADDARFRAALGTLRERYSEHREVAALARFVDAIEALWGEAL